MKTINVMTVSLAALLIAGCSQNEVTEVNPDAHPQMAFGVYTGTSTRGIDTDNNSIKEDPEASDKYGVSVSWGILQVAKRGKKPSLRPPPALCTTKW